LNSLSFVLKTAKKKRGEKIKKKKKKMSVNPPGPSGSASGTNSDNSESDYSSSSSYVSDDSSYSSSSASGSESGSDSGSNSSDSSTGGASNEASLAPKEVEEERDSESCEGFKQLMAEYYIDFDAKPIGNGAFSVVRLGKTRTTPPTLVAVKIVPVCFAKDVLKEAHTMMDLKHSSILHMRSLFVGDKNVYLVTDYAAGGELFSYIRDHGWLSEEVVSVIARKLLEGIKYLHDRGIVHRDLKPQNVLCATDDPTDIRIADFGLSKILSEDTMLKTCCGSPHYLAPEVLQCTEYDSKVDIWGIGIIVYVALTGCLPFFDDDMRKLIVKIMTANYTWPDDVSISSSAKDFVRRTLEKDPAKRPCVADCLLHPWIRRDKRPLRGAVLQLGSTKKM